MKLLKNRESGQTLIIALILLVLGSLLVVPLLNLSFTGIKHNQLIERQTLEAYSADSGLQYALCKLYNNPNQYLDTPLQESFTLNDRTVNVTAEYVATGLYQITSTAISPSGSSTTIESYVKVDVGVFTYVIATKENMELKDAIVDSSPEPGEGNIHSNTDIDLSGCIINGNASAVGIIFGQEQVIGIVTEGSAPIAFPEVKSDLYEELARAGGDPWLGDYIVTGTEHLGPLYIDGNLRVEGTVVENATLILDGTVYVTGMISVEYGNIDGDQTLLAEGDIRIEQGAIRSNIIPIIVSTKVNGEIYSEWGTTVDGVLYAPYGRIRLENGVHLYGAAGAKTAKIENCTITYAKQLSGREDIPGSELRTITYSFK